MSHAPLVSIIIPCYNSGDRLSACLQSCLQQMYKHVEILFVDNNSTDNSRAIAQQLAVGASFPIRLLHCQAQGANSARNYGLTQAQGDYIQWLDADDALAPDKIALQVAALEQHLEYDIAYGDWTWCFERQGARLLQLCFQGQQWNDSLLSMLMDNWQPPHAYLLRRSVALSLHQIQAWHPQTTVSMDRQYFTLAALLGFRFLHVPQVHVFYYHWSAAQITWTVSYDQRVESLKQMFLRFQRVAQGEGGDRLSTMHQSLLYQPWGRWTITKGSLQPIGGDRFLLIDLQQRRQLGLNYSQAMMVQVLLQINQPLTLEDLARLVVRRLWEAILKRQGVAEGSFDRLRQGAIGRELSLVVGGSGQVQEQSLSHDLMAVVGDRHDPEIGWSQLVPLYAPLFGMQRWVAYQLIDWLLQEGWLVTASVD